MHAKQLRVPSARLEAQLLFMWMWDDRECQGPGLEPSCPGKPKLKLRNSNMKQAESFTCGCRVCEDLFWKFKSRLHCPFRQHIYFVGINTM